MNVRSSIMGLLAAGGVALAGCVGLPSDGPSTGSITSAENLRILPLTLEALPGQRPTFIIPAEQVFAPTVSPERFVVIQGDILSVTLFEGLPDGVFATPATGGSVFADVPVREDGRIVLPYVGALAAEGRNTADIRQDILRRVRSFATRPDAVVEIKARNRGSVSVAGVVGAPGRLSIGSEILTVQDALSKAEAPYNTPYTTLVTIREEGGATRATLAEILAGPPLSLEGNTDIIVEVRPAVFQALGAVRRQGTLPLTRPEVTLLNALSDAGGLDPMRANPRGVFVFRAAEPADVDIRPIIFQLDMRQPDSFVIAQRFLIQPGDTVYVTEAPVAQWTKTLSAIQGTVALGTSAATIERFSTAN